MRMRAPSSFESPFPPRTREKFPLFLFVLLALPRDDDFPTTSNDERCARARVSCVVVVVVRARRRTEDLRETRDAFENGTLSRGEFVKKRTRFKRKRKETPGPRRGTRVRRAAIASRPIFVFF